MAKGINEPMFWVEKEKRFRAWKLKTERLFFRVAKNLNFLFPLKVYYVPSSVFMRYMLIYMLSLP
jgi:hypothetical protein